MTGSTIFTGRPITTFSIVFSFYRNIFRLMRTSHGFQIFFSGCVCKTRQSARLSNADIRGRFSQLCQNHRQSFVEIYDISQRISNKAFRHNHTGTSCRTDALMSSLSLFPPLDLRLIKILTLFNNFFLFSSYSSFFLLTLLSFSF